MYKKTLIKCSYLILSFVCFVHTEKAFGGLPTVPKAGQTINLSPDQIDRMTKELENIDKFFNSLPPEEQMEFLKQVEEAQKMINSLSEEELAQLMKDMEQLMPELFEGIPTEALTKPISQPDALTPINVQAPVKEAKVALTKEEEAVLECIESLIKLINECNVKINTSPEIPHFIQRWINNGKLKNWQKTNEPVSPRLDKLVQKLSNLKDQDPVSKQYRHLQQVNEEKTLFNLLKNLNTTLGDTIPKINVHAVGIEKIDSSSKKYLRDALETVGQSVNDIVQSIDKLITKFDPEANKIKASEKKDTLRAQQQAQTKPQQARTVVAGKSSENDSFGLSGSRDSDYPFYSGSASSYNYDTSSYSPSSQATGSKSPAATNQKNDSPSSSGTSVQPKTASGTKSSSVSPAAHADAKEKDGKKQSSFDKLIEEIIDTLTEIVDTIKEDKTLSNLEAYLKSSSPIDPKIINKLDQLQSEIDTLTKKIKNFYRKISDINSSLRSKYTSDFNRKWNKHKQPIIVLQSDINKIKNKVSALPADKQYGFFKVNISFGDDKEKPLQLNSSLIDLADSISKLESAAQK